MNVQDSQNDEHQKPNADANVQNVVVDLNAVIGLSGELKTVLKAVEMEAHGVVVPSTIVSELKTQDPRHRQSAILNLAQTFVSLFPAAYMDDAPAVILLDLAERWSEEGAGPLGKARDVLVLGVQTAGAWISIWLNLVSEAIRFVTSR
jgi:hypothetical protein